MTKEEKLVEEWLDERYLKDMRARKQCKEAYLAGLNYKTKENVYKMESENLEKREEIFNASKNKSKEELTIVDVYYRNSKIRTQKAYDEFLTSRAILENLVGKDAINKIEEDNS